MGGRARWQELSAMALAASRTFVPSGRDYPSLVAAFALAVSAGAGASVQLLKGDYFPAQNNPTKQPLPQASGVKWRGVGYLYSFNGIPDSGSTTASSAGTRLIGDGTFNCFEFNATDVADPTGLYGSGVPGQAAFTNAGLQNAGIEYLAIHNFKNGIKCGAKDSPSYWYSTLKRVTVTACTEWGVDIENFQHWAEDPDVITFGNVAGGQRWRCSGQGWLIPGNSKFSSLLNTVPTNNNIRSRGIVFEARGNSAMNDVTINHIQSNRFNPDTYNQAVTVTNALDIPCADLSKVMVGMPITSVAGGAGLTAKQTYYVSLVSADTGAGTFQVSDTKGGASKALTNGAVTWLTQGMECIEVVADSTSKIYSITMQGIDVESGGTTMFTMQNVAKGHFTFSAIADGGSTTALTARNSPYCYSFLVDGAKSDIDSNSSGSYFEGYRRAGPQRVGMGTYIDLDNGGRCVVNLFGGASDWNKGVSMWDVNGPPGYHMTRLGLPIAQRLVEKTATFSTGPADAGLITCNPVSGTPQTVTLPTITDTSVALSHLGMHFKVINLGTDTSTWNTDGTQTFNKVASKTSITLLPGQWMDVIANVAGTPGTGATPVLHYALFPGEGAGIRSAANDAAAAALTPPVRIGERYLNGNVVQQRIA